MSREKVRERKKSPGREGKMGPNPAKQLDLCRKKKKNNIENSRDKMMEKQGNWQVDRADTSGKGKESLENIERGRLFKHSRIHHYKREGSKTSMEG